MPIDPVKTRQIAEHKHDAPLMSCAFDPSGRFVLAGGRDRGLMCLEVAAGRKAVLEGHETWVSSAVSAGSHLVLTADYAGHVIAWDCSGETPKQCWNIEAHPSTIYALAANAGGELFATGGSEGTIRIWQTRDGKRTREIARLTYPVYGVAFHPDGRRLISADRQPKMPRIKLWDFAAGKELLEIDATALSAYRRVEDIEWGGIRGLTLSPDGNTLVACGSNEYAGPACALLFDITTGELKRKLVSSLKGFYYSARFHPQGFLVTAGGDVAKGEFRCWDPQQDASLADVQTAGPCTAIDIHPSGGSFVVAQSIGKKSYPDSGLLTIYEWSE